jgi:hypothetical protein
MTGFSLRVVCFYARAESVAMFNNLSPRFAVYALTVYAGSIALGQETTISTMPLSTLPQVSSERLGTGVPSRLPKVEVQRPVFTIQSGGPVALPIPQFRPIRETTSSSPTAYETKNNLPITEPSRAWQKSTLEETKPADRPYPTYSQTRPKASFTASPPVRSTAQATANSQAHLTAELPTAERKIVPPTTISPQRTQLRPPATTAPANENPARVLNFSIN